MKSIFKYVLFLVMVTFFMIVPLGCCKKIESHVMSNDIWLQEQVEKGHMTKEEADRYSTKIKVIHSK